MIKQRLSKFENIFDKSVFEKSYLVDITLAGGKLSAKLINGIRDEKSGNTILDYLIDDGISNRISCNLFTMMLFLLKRRYRKHKLLVTKIKVILKRSLSLCQGSPAIKKGILQSIKIVDELVKSNGRRKPESIVVEMARENQYTNQGKSNSQQRLKRLEKISQRVR